MCNGPCEACQGKQAALQKASAQNAFRRERQRARRGRLFRDNGSLSEFIGAHVWRILTLPVRCAARHRPGRLARTAQRRPLGKPRRPGLPSRPRVRGASRFNRRIGWFSSECSSRRPFSPSSSPPSRLGAALPSRSDCSAVPPPASTVASGSPAAFSTATAPGSLAGSAFPSCFFWWISFSVLRGAGWGAECGGSDSGESF